MAKEYKLKMDEDGNQEYYEDGQLVKTIKSKLTKIKETALFTEEQKAFLLELFK